MEILLKNYLNIKPFEWLEASFFYTNIQDKPYCDILTDVLCQQDYKDKGFNVKLRLKEQGKLPAIAVGINDIAGTGLFSSEYIVSSYGIKNIDVHFGIGWGTLNGSSKKIKNPLGYINDEFKIRPTNVADQGGQFQVSRYFSSEEVSPFYGIAYAFNEKLTFKIENDPTLAPSSIGYKKSKSDYSFGFDYSLMIIFQLEFQAKEVTILDLNLFTEIILSHPTKHMNIKLLIKLRIMMISIQS